jgi:hypothetical protein
MQTLTNIQITVNYCSAVGKVSAQRMNERARDVSISYSVLRVVITAFPPLELAKCLE